MKRWAAAVVTLAFLGVPGTAGAAETVTDPVVSLPPAGLFGHALWDSYYDLAPFGYQEQEYFVSGTARDAAGAAAAFTTRIIVTRPSSPARFNGTVLLDWTNVTAQFENAVDIMEARQMLMREGFAFVHVSAQAAGVCCIPLTPKAWDPVRYAALSHPGDAYADDMFSQVAKAVRAPRNGERPLGNLAVQRVLAAGQSQSASKLYDYVIATQPTARVIDGFLIHGGGGKTFPNPLQAKVLHLLSDFEANPSAPKAGEPNYRLWEIAGTAHSDFFIGYQSVVGLGPRVAAHTPRIGKAQYDALMETAGNYGEQIHPLLATCTVAGATMPMHYAASAAIHQLDAWVRTGQAPRNGPRFGFTAAGTQAKDVLGNAAGGIRLAPIDVPLARYVSTVCLLGGITIPLTDLEIQARYPTHADYYGRMRAAVDANVRDGWLLPIDAVDLMRRACAAKNRWLAPPATPCPAYAPPAFNVLSAAAAAPRPTVAPPEATLPATGGAPLGFGPVSMLLGLVARSVARARRTIAA